MSEYVSHIKKYEHNKDFISKGISSRTGDYSDWEVIARFYAALHFIEALLDKQFNEHASNHSNRNLQMCDHTDFFSRECIRDYTTLKALSQNVRYYIEKINTQDALKAQLCLENIEGDYLKYIIETS